MRIMITRCNIILPVLTGMLLINAQVLAQSDPSIIDSALTVLHASPHDTIKIDRYLSLYNAFIDKDTTQSIDYLRKALTLSEKIDDTLRLSTSYLVLGKLSSEKGDLDRAFEISSDLERLLSDFKHPEMKAKTYLFKGIIHTKSGNYDSALTDLFKGLEIFEMLEDQEQQGHCLLNIGNVYLKMGDNDKTLAFYQKALERYETIGYEEGIASVTGNLGVIHRRKEEYDLALKYIKQSLAANKILNRKANERIDLHNIGTIYFKLEDYELARKYFERAKELAAEIDSKRGLVYAYHSLAVVEANQDKFDEAFKNLDSALVLAVSAGMKNNIKDIYKSYSYNYEDAGEWKLALDYWKKYESVKDSILSENSLRQINELQTKYETAKKNEEIATLAKENERRVAEADRRATWNRILVGGLVLFAIMGGLVVFNVSSR